MNIVLTDCNTVNADDLVAGFGLSRLQKFDGSGCHGIALTLDVINYSGFGFRVAEIGVAGQLSFCTAGDIDIGNIQIVAVFVAEKFPEVIPHGHAEIGVQPRTGPDTGILPFAAVAERRKTVTDHVGPQRSAFDVADKGPDKGFAVFSPLTGSGAGQIFMSRFAIQIDTLIRVTAMPPVRTIVPT